MKSSRGVGIGVERGPHLEERRDDVSGFDIINDNKDLPLSSSSSSFCLNFHFPALAWAARGLASLIHNFIHLHFGPYLIFSSSVFQFIFWSFLHLHFSPYLVLFHAQCLVLSSFAHQSKFGLYFQREKHHTINHANDLNTCKFAL